MRTSVGLRFLSSMHCEDFTQCEDAALFCSSLDSVWVVSHWISCCSGISTFCCCIGWTYGSCAWQCSLWHDYRASSWLQSPSIFLSTPWHFLPFFAYLLHSNAYMSSNPCWPLPVCHRIGLENVFYFWVMNFHLLTRSEVCFESSCGNKPHKKWTSAHRLYTSQWKTWSSTFVGVLLTNPLLHCSSWPLTMTFVALTWMRHWVCPRWSAASLSTLTPLTKWPRSLPTSTRTTPWFLSGQRADN